MVLRDTVGGDREALLQAVRLSHFVRFKVRLLVILYPDCKSNTRDCKYYYLKVTPAAFASKPSGNLVEELAIAPVKFAHLKFALPKSAPVKFTKLKFAPVKSAKLKSNLYKYALLKYALIKMVKLKSDTFHLSTLISLSQC
jgi:hypothetical protein